MPGSRALHVLCAALLLALPMTAGAQRPSLNKLNAEVNQLQAEVQALQEQVDALEQSVFTTERRRAFITSEIFDGALGGVSGADAKCQSAADATELGGTWKAWIATESISSTPAARFTPSPSGYELLDGRMLGGTSLDEFPASLLTQLNTDENGQGVAGRSLVWTGLRQNGLPYELTSRCQEWTSNSPNDRGSAGTTSLTNFSWTITETPSCDLQFRLYCFEQ